MAWLGNPRPAFVPLSPGNSCRYRLPSGRVATGGVGPSAPVRPFKAVADGPTAVYRARDQVENEEWLAAIDEAAERLDLGGEAKSRAVDLFLSTLPDADRSKRATAAASLYAGALIAGQRRSQSEVAEAAGVSRLTVQKRWKALVDQAGLEPPSW